MEVSVPIFMIGIKDDITTDDIVKKHIGIEIILNMLIGKSSKLYSKLYKEGMLMSPPDIDYEFSSQYAHVLISGQSTNSKKVYEEILKEIEKMKQKEIDAKEFERIKKKIYGDYAIEYNNVSNIGRMFVSDFVKGINSFEYMEKFEQIDRDYIKKLLNCIFDEKKTVLSIVKGKA